MRMRRALVLWSVLLLCAGTSLGQTANVTHNVNLRQDPSTANPPIRLVLVGEQVMLLEAGKTAGYYHVTTAQNEEGWVWSPNVHVLAAIVTPTPTPAPGVTPSPTTIPTRSGGAAATSVDQNWSKPQPQEIDFATTSGTCAGDGSGGDTATNLRKNRVDTPTTYHSVTFDAVSTLAYPSDAKSRGSWTAAHLAQITKYEGVALTVTGYLSHAIHVEGKEYCNCRFTKPTEVDWHLYLTKQPEQNIANAVVIETTPRVRANHPGWSVDKLTPWLDSTDQVRISGWLMLDPEHADQVGQFRGTIWEIHPITKIEVWQNGGWVDLETVS